MKLLFWHEENWREELFITFILVPAGIVALMAVMAVVVTSDKIKELRKKK